MPAKLLRPRRAGGQLMLTERRNIPKEDFIGVFY